jgi:hypothetical protein
MVDLIEIMEKLMLEIPEEYRRNALLLAQEKTTAKHYNLRKVLNTSSSFIVQESLFTGVGALVGLISGDPLEGAKIGALLGGIDYGVTLGFKYLIFQTRQYKEIPEPERRTAKELIYMGSLAKYAKNPLGISVRDAISNAVFIGIYGKIITGQWTPAAMGAIVGFVNAGILTYKANQMLDKIRDYTPNIVVESRNSNTTLPPIGTSF